jgi:hypothetical protein
MHGFPDFPKQREMPIFIPLLAAAAFCCAATAALAHQAATTPATQAALVPGERIAIEALLGALAEKTGIIIVKSDSIPGDVVITRELPDDPQKAIDALNEMLAPAGYKGVPSLAGSNGTPSKSHRIVVRIQSTGEARTQELQTGPVTFGSDPRKIDISDRNRMVTHIAPVTHPNLLNNAKRAAADVSDVTITVTGTPETGMQLILTGPALSVKKSLENAIAVDPPPAQNQLVRSIRLRNLDAEGSAATVNTTYGVDAAGNQVLNAVADKRSNTLILSGTDIAVLQAMQMLERLDAVPSGPQKLPEVVPPQRLLPPPAKPPRPVTPGNMTQPRSPSALLDGTRPVAENASLTRVTAAPPVDASHPLPI